MKFALRHLPILIAVQLFEQRAGRCGELAEIDAVAAAEDLAYVRVVFDGLVNELVRWQRPMPRSVARARAILDRALSCAMSLERKQIGPDDEELSSENIIGTDEAAKLLGEHPELSELLRLLFLAWSLGHRRLVLGLRGGK